MKAVQSAWMSEEMFLSTYTSIYLTSVVKSCHCFPHIAYIVGEPSSLLIATQAYVVPFQKCSYFFYKVQGQGWIKDWEMKSRWEESGEKHSGEADT